MGILCCKKDGVTSNAIEDPSNPNNPKPIVPTEREISIPKYESSHDKTFSKLETTYNLLREISFEDFAYSLSIFSTENATLVDDYAKKPQTYAKADAFFKESLSLELFQSFIENKLYKHPQLYTTAGSNETLASTCKDCLLEIHKNLGKKMKQSDKEKGLPEDPERVKKCHLLALGLLYCTGSNVAKARIFFNLFKEGDKMTSSEELKDFLLALFLIPAYCLLYVRYKFAKNPDIGEFTKEEMQTVLNTCELKDSMHLVDVTIDTMFKGNESGIDYETFKTKLQLQEKENGLGYLFSAKGVRKLLEANNV